MMETEDLDCLNDQMNGRLDRFLMIPLPNKGLVWQSTKSLQEWLEPHGEESGSNHTLDEISEEEYEDFIERG